VSNYASSVAVVCAAQHKLGSGLKVLGFSTQPMVIPGDATK
jgi:hypothetical protein